MKKIKVYSVRQKPFKFFHLKVAILTTLFLLLFSVLNLFNTSNFLTDILQNSKISQAQLDTAVKQLNFDGTIWPVKEITDLNYRHLSNAWITYEEIRKMSWDKVPASLKTDFPNTWIDYISKYKNVTLQTCWDTFTDPDELANFTFRRRVLRTIWTASYADNNIWKKNTWTHAGIDIIWNIWTPVYSIANWVVVQIKRSDKGFWNLVSILYKKWENYYLWLYGHLSSISPNIKVWQLVKKGDEIWKLGDSWNSFGAHLHFQINRVFTLQDIITWRSMIWWYHNLDWVKAYTIDPIQFIEENMSGSTENEIEEWRLDKVTATSVSQPDTPVVTKVVKQENETLSLSQKEEGFTGDNKAYIKKLDLSLMNNRIQLWHWFTLNLVVHPGTGKIAIVPSNSNLSFFPDKIINPTKDKYTINFLAIKEGETKLRILDGKTEREYIIKIYNPDSEDIYWILIVPESNLNLLSQTKVSIYPTDKYWKKIDKVLKDDFAVYFYKQWKKELLKNIKLDKNINYFYVKGSSLGWGKLVVENNKYYSKINIKTDVAKDYSYDREYAQDMATLIKNNILKGDQWRLFPDRKLTRRELIIILWRTILKTDYEKAKIDMWNYLKTKWRFFKDIDGKQYADPYIYDAWKKWIIKWENNLSLANNYVSKAELLTILTRVFNIKTEENSLSSWADLQSGSLKAIADTARKYNLYPFKNYKVFNAWELVTREISFETLKRFIDFKDDNGEIIHTSAEVEDANPEENLEQVMWDIFDF